jgi:hypothetical protein
MSFMFPPDEESDICRILLWQNKWLMHSTDAWYEVQWIMSKANLLGTSFCVQNRQVLVWFIQVKLTKIFFTETLFKDWFIQDSDLFRVWFKQISLYILIVLHINIHSYTVYEWTFIWRTIRILQVYGTIKLNKLPVSIVCRILKHANSFVSLWCTSEWQNCVIQDTKQRYQILIYS